MSKDIELLEAIQEMVESRVITKDEAKQRIEPLVKEGANLEAISLMRVANEKVEINPMRLAVMSGNVAVISALVELDTKIDSDHIFADHCTTIALAAQMDNVKAIEYLAAAGGAVEKTETHKIGALEMAVRIGSVSDS